MTFGLLIEYNMRNIILEVEKLVSDPFLEYQNWEYLWVNSLKCYTVCFYCISNWELPNYIETKLQTTCFYLILSIF